jgi:hypothetical protein
LAYRAFNKFFSANPKDRGADSSSISDKDGIEFKAFNRWFDELKFYEAVCWAYGCRKSSLREVFWLNSYEDLQLTLQLKVADRKIEAVQAYEAMANVVSQAFGSSEPEGKKELSKVKVADRNSAKTSHEAIKMFSDIFGRG